jgi:hypothetical protein
MSWVLHFQDQTINACAFLLINRNLLAYDTFVSDVRPTKIERVALVSQVGERLDVTYRIEIVRKVSCV